MRRGVRRAPVGRGRAGQAGVPPLYVWNDGANFVPPAMPFDDSTSGVTPQCPCDPATASPSELFTAFFDDEVVKLLADETNVHFASKRRLGTGWRPHDHRKPWVNVTVPEMYVFLALAMLMIHVKKHRLQDYWAKDEFIATPAFNKHMTRDRFIEILSCLHLIDNSLRPEGDDADRLWKVRPLYDRIRHRFSAFFKPYQKLCIDESLVLFRGHVGFKQYIPSKRHRFGLKLFVICDCKTGYILDFSLYSGRGGEFEADEAVGGYGGDVVKKFMAKDNNRYLYKYHIMYTDNYYTSPLLADYLLARGTGSVGTVRKARKHFPLFPGVRNKGDFSTMQHGDMLAVCWYDTRVVRFLTTVQQGELVNTGRVDRVTRQPIVKPDVVLDYTINMRLVDKSDMMITSIDCLRKTCRWYRKFIFHTVDLAILNACNLYRHRAVP